MKCYALEELKIYDVEKIGEGAFFNCVGMERLWIASTVKDMINAFHYGNYKMSVYFGAEGIDLPYGWTGADYYCAGEIRTGVRF